MKQKGKKKTDICILQKERLTQFHFLKGNQIQLSKCTAFSLDSFSNECSPRLTKVIPTETTNYGKKMSWCQTKRQTEMTMLLLLLNKVFCCFLFYFYFLLILLQLEIYFEIGTFIFLVCVYCLLPHKKKMVTISK